MSINTFRPQELIEQRKIVSDAKNDTESLIFKEPKDNGTRASSYTKTRALKDKMNIQFLEQQTDADYLLELGGDL